MSASRQSADLEATADALHSGAIRLLRLLRREDAATGVTGPQLSALSVLVFGGPQTLTRLAGAEQVSLPTMSRLLTELERRGLVERTASAEDRRTAQVAATVEGAALMAEGRRLRLARLVSALERLDGEDREVLDRAARVMLRLGEGG